MKFNIELHPKAEKKARDLLRKNPELIPEFQEYRRILAEEPHKFPKKESLNHIEFRVLL